MQDTNEEKKKRKRTIKVEGGGDGSSGDSKTDVKRIRSDKQVIEFGRIVLNFLMLHVCHRCTLIRTAYFGQLKW